MSCQPRKNKEVYIWLENKQSCLLCDEMTDTALPLCHPCEQQLPWLLDCCPRCALPMGQAGLLCADCLKRPPAFQQVHAPWIYGFPIDSLISQFKHRSHFPFGYLLAELLGRSLQDRFEHGLMRPSALLPVPMTDRRQRRRGYNQATLLAQWLGRHLALPCQQDLLRRVQDTPAQQQLDARARQRNLLKAFALAPAAQVEGLHLALVDDVLTTGATAQALARLLMRAGAARVDIYCLARTPKPGALA